MVVSWKAVAVASVSWFWPLGGCRMSGWLSGELKR